jgi:hypothetical protein
LWAGCWDDSHLYAIDPATWSVLDKVAAPGKPFGIAAFGGDLRVVLADEGDDRYLYRFTPGRGFDLASKMPCPDLTGSHLASDGGELFLGQMANQRVLVLDASGSPTRAIKLPTRCAGIGFGLGGFHMISADEEFEELQLARLDLQSADPDMVPVAVMPSDARALAFNGDTWWTSLRELSEILSFSIGDGA